MDPGELSFLEATPSPAHREGVPDQLSAGGDNMVSASPSYEDAALWEGIGCVLRPGGLQLTGRALGLCRFEPGARLLDVGCGLGASAGFLKAKGFDVVGVEPSTVLLAEARRRYPGIELREGRAEALPFGDATFHGVFMECVLSLVDDRQRALREAARVLRTGGRLVVSDVYARCGGGQGDTAQAWERLLRDCALTLEVWQDHSAELVQLVARTVFAGIPVARLARLLGCRTGPCAAALLLPEPAVSAATVRRDKVGYFLAVARPTTTGLGRTDSCKGPVLR